MQIKYIGPDLDGVRVSEGGYSYLLPYNQPVTVAAGFLDLGILENPNFVAVDPEAAEYVPVPPATKQTAEFWSDGTLRGQQDGTQIPVESRAQIAVVPDYDDDGNITSLTVDGVETTYEYDADGNVETINHGDGRVETLSYNSDGDYTGSVFA